LFATSAATTVVGTVAGYQFVGVNFVVERTSPFSCTCADDWIAHPSCKLSLALGSGALQVVAALARTTIMIHPGT
jgi:hypothetical protein